MSDPVLEVEGFSKRYGDFLAVDDLGFEVRSGEIVGLAGPNGAGKTTTLRSIVGIVRPTSGRIRVEGHDTAVEPVEAKRRTGFVPDEPRLFDYLTVGEHLEFTARLYGVRGHEARSRALLAEFGLDGKRDALPSELSRGMRQKVAVVCVLLRDPALLLLDEPLTGLDPLGIKLLKDVMRRRADEGAAVLVSSHLLDLVEGLCDRFLLLLAGRRIVLGTLDEMRATIAGAGPASSLEDLFLLATATREAPPGTPPADA